MESDKFQQGSIQNSEQFAIPPAGAGRLDPNFEFQKVHNAQATPKQLGPVDCTAHFEWIRHER
jgi:hypothetical protein